MTQNERLEKIEAMETVVFAFNSALTYAKVLARMEANGKIPDKHTLLDIIDESIDCWNVVINMIPAAIVILIELKKLKLDLMHAKTK